MQNWPLSSPGRWGRVGSTGVSAGSLTLTLAPGEQPHTLQQQQVGWESWPDHSSLCGGLDEGKIPSSSVWPHHLRQMGDLNLGSCEQKSWLCHSSAVALRRAASAPHLGSSTVELTRVADCGCESQSKGRESRQSHPSSSPSFLADRRTGPGIMRVGELAMSLTGCNTWESGPCTSPGQQGRAGPGCGLQSMRAGGPG